MIDEASDPHYKEALKDNNWLNTQTYHYPKLHPKNSNNILAYKNKLIDFVNESDFIRVVDNSTNVKTYIDKKKRF